MGATYLDRPLSAVVTQYDLLRRAFFTDGTFSDEDLPEIREALDAVVGLLDDLRRVLSEKSIADAVARAGAA